MQVLANLPRVAVKNILIATDFSSQSQNALECALSLSRRFDCKLFIAHAVQPYVPTSAMEPPVVACDILRMAGLEQKVDMKSVPHEVILNPGEPWQVISEAISDKHIDLLVMGTHGREGFSKLFLGSTAEQAMRHAACPVLTVGPEAECSLDHIDTIVCTLR